MAIVTYKMGDKEIVIRASKGTETYQWQHTCFKHRITISIGDKKVSFTFYNSQNAYEAGHIYLDTREMFDALRCFLEDGLAYHNSDDFESFYAEFGYDGDSDSRKIYNACKKQFNKALSLGLSIDDMCNIINKINDEE